MAMNFDPNFLNLITQIMGGVSSRVNNAVLGAPMPTQGTPQSSALTDLAQKRAQAGQQVLGGVLSGPSAVAQAAPAAPRKPQGALSPLQQVELGRPVAEAYADDGAAQGPQQNAPALDLESFAAPPDLSMGPQQNQPVLNLAQYEQGILGKIGDAVGPNFLGRLGDGLLVAGSQDPSRALAQVSAQRAEEAETQAKRAAAGRPKVTPLADGAFSLVSYPDGSTRIVRNSEVAAYQTQKTELASANKLVQMLLQGKIAAEAGAAKDATKAQNENAPDKAQTAAAVSELTTLADMLGSTDTATGPLVGLVPKIGRDIITPGGADIQDRAERIIQASLRATLGAQFTEKEGARFLERAYNPRLDEATNAARLRMVAQEIQAIQDNKEAAIEHMRKRGSLEGFTPGAAPQASQAAPKAGGMAVPGLSERASKYFN